MIIVNRMERVFAPGLLLLTILSSACSIKTTYEFNSVSADEAVQKKQFSTGDQVSIYTNDDNEIAMYLSYYDTEKFVGYVIYVHEKHANRYQYSDENVNPAENIEEVPIEYIKKIVFVEKFEDISMNKKVLGCLIVYALGDRTAC